MSSEAIASVLSFYGKGLELEEKGHIMRAAEYHARAFDAARDLGGQDNLVAIEMQRAQSNALKNYAAASVAVAKTSEALLDSLKSSAAHRVDCIALLSAAVAALERRRAAASLLEGKCTAVEEAWFTANLRHAQVPAIEAGMRAPLVGYEIFLRVAKTVLNTLTNAWLYVKECSGTQFEAFIQHIVHAVDLMRQPRSHGTFTLTQEVGVTERLSHIVANRMGECGLDERLEQLLIGAWQRLQQSGVLETRGILHQIRREDVTAAASKHRSTINAALSAPGLRSCNLASCGAREAHPEHFKRCAACRMVVYCCRDHQVEDWPAHKQPCKAARKAAAASADDGAGPGAAS